MYSRFVPHSTLLGMAYYRYGEAKPTLVTDDIQPPLDHATIETAALATRPTGVLCDLEHAIVDANPALIKQRIAQVRSYDSELADTLEALIGLFEHSNVLARIQKARAVQE